MKEAEGMVLKFPGVCLWREEEGGGSTPFLALRGAPAPGGQLVPTGRPSERGLIGRCLCVNLFWQLIGLTPILVPVCLLCCYSVPVMNYLFFHHLYQNSVQWENHEEERKETLLVILLSPMSTFKATSRIKIKNFSKCERIERWDCGNMAIGRNWN